MSLLGSLGSSLDAMSFTQLACAFVAVLGYSLALNGSLATRVRWSAAGSALAGAALFATLTPSWMGGVVLMLLGVLSLGVVAAGAWLIASMFDLDGPRAIGLAVVPADAAVAVAPRLHGLAAARATVRAS